MPTEDVFTAAIGYAVQELDLDFGVVFASQVTLDIVHILRDGTKKALEELKLVGKNALKISSGLH